ncbi:hypothetical protein EON77_12510 [bacterium]|nr:MAG: hypothetical protein EON77_12510 [bacterium]
MFSDTIRQLESVASADLVPQATVDILVAAYQGYRATTHHRSLEGLPAVVEGEVHDAAREAVAAIWSASLPATPATTV